MRPSTVSVSTQSPTSIGWKEISAHSSAMKSEYNE